MPQTKSAKRALRKDRRRTEFNQLAKKKLKKLLSLARKKPTPENLKKAFSILDQTAKKKIIHKKKAARLKSRLTKRMAKQQKEPKISAPLKTKKRKLSS